MALKVRNKFLAVIWSLISPGFGQIYLGRFKRGVIICIFVFTIQLSGALYLANPNTHGSFGPDILIFILYLGNLIDVLILSNRTEGPTYGKKCLLAYLLILLIGVSCALYIRKNIVQPFKVPAASMTPTILKDDHVFADKRVYKKEDPKRGDIVVFIYPEDKKKNFIKRIVGLPNETVEIKSGSILVNGEPVTQPEIFKKIYYYNKGNYGADGQVVNVPSGSYFVLGDNSEFSYDSRYWGFVPKSSILGKVYKIFAPENHSGPIS